MTSPGNQTTMHREAGRGVLAAVVTEVLYGSSFVFTKGATDRVDVFTLLGWRFVMALVLLVVLVALRVVRLRIERRTLVPLLLLAALQPLLYYVGETFGVQRTTASESGLIISSIPVFVVLVSSLAGRRPTRTQALGIALTLVGAVATAVAGGLRLGFDLVGYAWLGLAVVSYALYAVLADRFGHAGDLERTAVMVACGAVLFGGIALGEHRHELGRLATLPLHDHTLLVSVLVLAVGPTIGAFFLQNVAIRHLGSNGYAGFIGLSAVVAVVCGMTVLGERPSVVQLVGGALILVGVYVANRGPAVRAEMP